MPCFKCGAVQTDPRKGGPAPWARGVIGDEQILFCPECQAEDPSWTEQLRVCEACGSTRLQIVIGTIVCRACGHDQTVRGD